MKTKISFVIFLLGLVGIFSSCEKDGDMLKMLENPVAPQLTTLPSLTLERSKGNEMLTFQGASVDPGFDASATYFLEACASGNNFQKVIPIYSGVSVDGIKISVSDLNQKLLKAFAPDATHSVDFRLRSVLVVDAGTGAPGTGADLFEYVSETKTANVSIYGLLRLDLINSGMDQKVLSALGDGKYVNYVKLDKDKPFTLLDPETNKKYSANGASLVEGGTTGIVVSETGWYELKADIKALTYSTKSYMIGLVGSATPNGWNTPDQKMDYDVLTGTWSITVNLVEGEIKFRKNDGWSWNLGKDGEDGMLKHDGPNIAVTSSGSYTITLTIIDDAAEKASYKIVKNN